MDFLVSRLFDWVLPLLVEALVRVGPTLGPQLDRLLNRFRASLDVFEVNDFRVSLDVKDARGHRAVYTRRERVRFLRDHVTTFYDYGWGTGETFASHRITPGRVVDRQRVGPRYRSLVLLPKPKRRGERLTFTVRRAIRRGGFGGRANWLEADIYYKTRRAQLRVSVPGPPGAVSPAGMRRGEFTGTNPVRESRATGDGVDHLNTAGRRPLHPALGMVDQRKAARCAVSPLFD